MSLLAPSTSATGESALQKEARLFKESFTRLIDAFLNRMFDLRPEKAVRRMWYLIILMFASGFLISLYYYPLNLWMQHIQDIIYYFLYPAYAAEYIGDPFTNIFIFGIRVFTDAHVLQYLPVFLAAFFIALQSAAIYLADVFELDDVSIARSFIWEVALTGSDETMRITQGDILAEHRTSSNYLIGGPGRVVVDLDSVALFEKPDGTPRIIGPTGKEPGGKATLDGFERFRQALDLRDHFIELRDQDEKSFAVHSRSLDGIPITATDVRFMFSVHRDGQKPTPDNPYPFSRRAVKQMVYKATSRVTPDLTNPSTFEFSWVNNMISLIRGRLGGFMNEHKLTEYLASIGMPEYERVKQREEKISEEAQKLALSSKDDLPKGKDIKPPPEFTPRYEIKNLFSQFAEEFSESARERGVELHWIGLGTWKAPTEIIPETKVVPEKHLDAWRISRENLAKGNDGAMENYKNEAILQEMMALIQDVPITAYQTATAKYDHNNAIRDILVAYRQQLMNAAEFLQAKGEPIPQIIIKAIEFIYELLGYKGWHWVGKNKLVPSNLSEPVIVIDQTVGVAQIKDLPANGKLQVGQTYHLQVDVLQDIEDSTIPIEIFSDEEQIIDIVILANEMSIYPEWFHEVVITRQSKSKPPEFTIIPLSPGLRTITIQYYYKLHLLGQIKYKVEVVES
jgi:hypothetical protein